MSPTVNQVLEMLLEKGGFIRDGHPTPGLISAINARTAPDTDLRYTGLFNKMEGGSSTSDLIYEVPSHSSELPGTPCIYFKGIDDPSADIFVSLRKRLWNHGRIPTLWIVTPDSVRIYDSFARPQQDDEHRPDKNLLGELRCIGNHMQGLEEFHKSRFDTGDFWQTGQGREIDPSQRVDSALLRDLSETEKHLVSNGLKPSVAHALLGRAIFVKYLEDRKILRPPDLQNFANCSEFKELLNDKLSTYSFFEWLRSTFNGDLFPLDPDENQSVQLSHLQTLWHFLSGYDMRSMQGRLWPYSFDIIPIELISSIYEMFAHALGTQSAEAISIHYTRFNLVELMLSLGMQGLHHTARVLDPACGSGVFLVEAFRRLVWRRAHKYGRPLRRDELHEMLRTQIFGMDIDRDAVYVAAFSLYLALLELDPEPYPPSLDALRLPSLLKANETDSQPQNLYVQDFFNTKHAFNQKPPFSNQEFNLIVSNPPWTALKKSTAPKDPDNPDSGLQWGLQYCYQEKIPDNKADQAYIWRARDFSNPKTRTAFVVGSRLFYQTSTTAERWRRKFLENNTVDDVVNLSDLVNENLLFGQRSSTEKSSTRLPASIVLYSRQQPGVDNLVRYIVPKWYPGIRRRNEILISGKDIQLLPQKLLSENTFLWKTAFRGTPRDFQLLRSLLDFSTLDQILLDANILEPIHRLSGITFGTNPTKDASKLAGLPFLEAGSIQRYRIRVVDCATFNRSCIAEKSNSRVLQLPALILSRTLRNNKLCVALVDPSGNRDRIVFDQRYYGISFAHTPASLAYRLNAILNSKLSLYMIFMLSSSLGWNWRTIEPKDWMQIRVPPSISDSDEAWDHILNKEQWLRKNWQPNATGTLAKDIAQAEEAIDNEIYRLYKLSDQNIVLIEDTLKYTVQPFLERSIGGAIDTLRKPTSEQLVSYAKRLCSQINGILRQPGLELSASVLISESQLLDACRFTLRTRSNTPPVVESKLTGIEEVLRQISPRLRAKVADHLYVRRDLRVYDGHTFWIIKPAEIQLWSEAAALNDADTVVSEHMESST